MPGGVQLLPDGEQHRKSLQRVADHVIKLGGSATLVAGALLTGDDAAITAFNTARLAAYEEWILEVHTVAAGEATVGDVVRMKRRLDRIRAIDFFAAGDPERIAFALDTIQAAADRHPDVGRATPGTPFRARELHGRVWVTRRGIGIDRIASAWLIARFIDPRPRFRFVDPLRYVHERRELRFDMAGGEFTHEGDWCSFETIVHRCGVDPDEALSHIGRVIHQLDIDDDRYDLPDAREVSSAIEHILRENLRDEDRLTAGNRVLDDMLERVRATAIVEPT